MHLDNGHTSPPASPLLHHHPHQQNLPPMQNSSATNLPSLSSTHPINGTLQSQWLHNSTHGISPADSTSTPSPPPPPPPRSTKRTIISTTASSKRAVQLAQHEIRSKLREDWSWPPITGLPCSHQAVNLPEEANDAWREREGGFDTESESSAVGTDPYQYEDADAVGAGSLKEEGKGKEEVEGELRKRKRKRESEQKFREEMAWNEGLRCFVERRDVWSGARMHRPSSGHTDMARKRCAIYAPPTGEGDAATRILELPSSPHTPPPPAAEAPSLTLVPLAPPILPPTNSVRASITPATYPSIYSKIVIQGLSPTVPINLSDVVGALVQGWKDNDEWPPKTAEEKAGEIEGGGGRRVGGGGGGIGELDGAGVRKGVRRGMGKVKKALGFSGIVDGDGGERDVGVNEGINDLREFDGRYD